MSYDLDFVVNDTDENPIEDFTVSVYDQDDPPNLIDSDDTDSGGEVTLTGITDDWVDVDCAIGTVPNVSEGVDTEIDVDDEVVLPLKAPPDCPDEFPTPPEDDLNFTTFWTEWNDFATAFNAWRADYLTFLEWYSDESFPHTQRPTPPTDPAPDCPSAGTLESPSSYYDDFVAAVNEWDCSAYSTFPYNYVEFRDGSTSYTGYTDWFLNWP